MFKRLGAALRALGQRFMHILAEYLGRSSVHGVYYIGLTSRTYLERFVWLAAVTASIYLSAQDIYGLFHRSQTNPIQMTQSDRTTTTNEVCVGLSFS